MTRAEATVDLSVVIPVLDEERVLPRLLASLAAQRPRAREVVVVDGGSRDRSREVALALRGRLPGLRLVESPRRGVAAQKNLGASLASGRWLLFLDADTVAPPGFLGEALSEARRRGLTVASPLSDPVERGLRPRLVFSAFNAWMLACARLRPQAPGYCQLFSRDLFAGLGGFDESLVLCEEMEILDRARGAGRFGILREVRILASARRFEAHGYLRTSLQQLAILAHRLLLGEIRHRRFHYPFDRHPARRAPRRRRGAR